MKKGEKQNIGNLPMLRLVYFIICDVQCVLGL